MMRLDPRRWLARQRLFPGLSAPTPPQHALQQPLVPLVPDRGTASDGSDAWSRAAAAVDMQRAGLMGAMGGELVVDPMVERLVNGKMRYPRPWGGSWGADYWFYVRNNDKLLGICCAYHGAYNGQATRHPFSRRARLVLLFNSLVGPRGARPAPRRGRPDDRAAAWPRGNPRVPHIRAGAGSPADRVVRDRSEEGGPRRRLGTQARLLRRGGDRCGASVLLGLARAAHWRPGRDVGGWTPTFACACPRSPSLRPAMKLAQMYCVYSKWWCFSPCAPPCPCAPPAFLSCCGFYCPTASGHTGWVRGGGRHANAPSVVRGG